MNSPIKFSSLNAIFKKARGVALASVVVGTALLTGCASNPAQAASQYNQYGGQYVQTVAATPAMRPDTIYVYAFASDASDVKLDNHGMISKIGSALSGDSQAQKETQGWWLRRTPGNDRNTSGIEPTPVTGLYRGSKAGMVARISSTHSAGTGGICH